MLSFILIVNYLLPDYCLQPTNITGFNLCIHSFSGMKNGEFQWNERLETRNKPKNVKFAE